MEGDGETVFRHACKLGLEGIVSKRTDSPYRSGRSPDWLKMKNADAPAVKREEEEDWGKERRRNHHRGLYSWSRAKRPRITTYDRKFHLCRRSSRRGAQCHGDV